jgi:hypothetical protein
MAGGSGANAYWPGFVDALTNVVIAMIFVVVVLAISLSFAAQMMGHKIAARLIQEHAAKAAASASAVNGGAGSAVQTTPSKLAGQTRIAVAGNEKVDTPSSVQTRSNFLQLDYAPGALTLDPPAAERVRAAVGAASQTSRSRHIEIVGTGPQMFSTESQRAAYLRVMAVRNQMLELGYTPEQIKVRIDAQASPAQAQVNVLISEP